MNNKIPPIRVFEAGKGKRLPGVSYKEAFSKTPGTVGGPNSRGGLIINDKHNIPTRDVPELRMEKDLGSQCEISFETRAEEHEW